MQPNLTFAAANTITLGELTPLWNRAYEAYVVPLVFDVPQLAWHITRADIDRSKSVIGLLDGKSFGLSLAGIRGDRAWIGGFGIALEHRRKGLASRLMAEHLSRLRAAGVREVSLEVIDINPAGEVYRRCGFAQTRELVAFAGPAQPGPDELVELGAEELAEVHARLHGAPPTWRRQAETLVNDIEAGADALALRRSGEVAAFAVAQPSGGRLNLLDAAATEPESATALLGALAAKWPGHDLRLIDEPPGTPMAQAAERLRFSVLLKQVEMVSSL